MEPTNEAIEKFSDAVVFGDLKEAKSLIAKYPQIVNAKDKYGFTALHNIMTEEQFEILELLLVEGADPNVKNDEGIASLHLAAWVKNADLLLKAGANINTVDLQGNTPLHILAGDGEERAEVIKFLISKGANKELKNKKGETAFEIAQLRHSDDVLDLLR